MGCDIWVYPEIIRGDGKYDYLPLGELFYRDYGLFGFLGNVRNYSKVPFLSDRRGLPEDVSEYVENEYKKSYCDNHSVSWLSLDELNRFDYNQTFEDRRFAKQIAPNFISGSEICESGNGELITIKEFLGESFFNVLDKLNQSEINRIIFWFDNDW